MIKWKIHCDNDMYCGMYSDHVAMAETEKELYNPAQLQAYGTFSDMGGQNNFMKRS